MIPMYTLVQGAKRERDLRHPLAIARSEAAQVFQHMPAQVRGTRWLTLDHEPVGIDRVRVHGQLFLTRGGHVLINWGLERARDAGIDWGVEWGVLLFPFLPRLPVIVTPVPRTAQFQDIFGDRWSPTDTEGVCCVCGEPVVGSALRTEGVLVHHHLPCVIEWQRS